MVGYAAKFTDEEIRELRTLVVDHVPKEIVFKVHYTVPPSHPLYQALEKLDLRIGHYEYEEFLAQMEEEQAEEAEE